MTDWHNHTCPKCWTIWVHDNWDCQLMDGDALCKNCQEDEKDGEETDPVR